MVVTGQCVLDAQVLHKMYCTSMPRMFDGDDF